MKRITVLVLVTLLSLGSLFQGTGLAVTEATKPDVTCTPGTEYSCAIPLTGPATGAVAQDTTVYYKFPAIGGVTYSVGLVPSDGDADLYVRHPDRTSAGYSERSGIAGDTVTFTAAQNGHYYVLVQGHQTSNYTLRISTGLSVSVSNKTVGLNASTQITAYATALDGQAVDVTNDVSWTSSEPKVATVTGGRITGVTKGTAIIMAKYDGYSAKVTVTVLPVVGLTLTPHPMVIKSLSGNHLSATAMFSNGTNADVSADALWRSLNASVIAADSEGKGYIYAYSAGYAKIITSYGGVKASALVTAIDVSSITLTPTTVNVAGGQSQQMTLTAHLPEGDSIDVTTSSRWATDNPSIASVTSSGRLDGDGPGSTRVTADFYGHTAHAAVTVTCDPGAGFGCPLTLIGQSNGYVHWDQVSYYQFAATAGTTYDVALRSNTDADLTVYNPDRTEVGHSRKDGRFDLVSFTAFTPGNYYVAVKGFAGGIYTLKMTPLTEPPVTVNALAVNPARVPLVIGDSRQLIASAAFSNKPGVIVSAKTLWRSSDNTVATVSDTGVVTGVGPGTATITAAYGAKSASVVVPVKSLSGLSVSPSSIQLKSEEHTNLKATATYTDGTSEDVTAVASWHSSDSLIAAARDDGYVRAFDTAGKATVTGSYGGLTASSTVSVIRVAWVDIFPESPTIRVGQTFELRALAIYSDSTAASASDLVTWGSDNPEIATVSSTGIVTGISPGRARITYQYQCCAGPVFVTVLSANYAADAPSTASIEARRTAGLGYAPRPDSPA